MNKLGKMIKIDDLRSVWPHEALDFTKWLAEEENLSLLGDTIGIELCLVERESSVGSFNVDIYAKEVGTERNVIIENQLEDTDHDHLGKLITYASGKGAEVVVWIVKRARDEHRQAIEWLNQKIGDKIDFFLLEIELWQIGNSEKAPRFNIVEKPNYWSKTMKLKEELSGSKLFKFDFWTGFNEAMNDNKDFLSHFRLRKALAEDWYGLSIGSSVYHIELKVKTKEQNIAAEIYIKNNRELFEQFRKHSDEISKMLNSEVEWLETDTRYRIIITNNINPCERDNWPKAYEWFLEKAIVYKNIAAKFGE